ncbi:MAG TPA: PPOX class F420-dependent oxidoreductase [Acidimicrobiia bacterium]|nr:PPOX class F420-dependent oxidoreductase [Acidimicrobiia bacterium]
MSRPVARNLRINRDELHDLLRVRHRAVLLTTRRDGRAQLSPVTCGLDARGLVTIATYPSRAKVANIRREPQASLCVVSDEWDGPWVQLDGRAEVVDLPAAEDGLVEYYRAISGEHPDWAEYRRAMRRRGKCLIRVEIERWGPMATGGFPPEPAA